LRNVDRPFWICASRCFASWRNVLLIVKPEIVLRWHRRIGVPIGGPHLNLREEFIISCEHASIRAAMRWTTNLCLGVTSVKWMMTS
jgi:hypothetical protein